MFSSIMKVLVVVGTTFNISMACCIAMRRLRELTLAHAFLTKDVNPIIDIYVKMFYLYLF